MTEVWKANPTPPTKAPTTAVTMPRTTASVASCPLPPCGETTPARTAGRRLTGIRTTWLITPTRMDTTNVMPRIRHQLARVSSHDRRDQGEGEKGRGAPNVGEEERQDDGQQHHGRNPRRDQQRSQSDQGADP